MSFWRFLWHLSVRSVREAFKLTRLVMSCISLLGAWILPRLFAHPFAWLPAAVLGALVICQILVVSWEMVDERQRIIGHRNHIADAENALNTIVIFRNAGLEIRNRHMSPGHDFVIRLDQLKADYRVWLTGIRGALTMHEASKVDSVLGPYHGANLPVCLEAVQQSVGRLAKQLEVLESTCDDRQRHIDSMKLELIKATQKMTP